MIHFKDVHIGHQNPLFHVEEMELRRGQLYILVGRNGAGKSTLMNTLIGQQAILSGELLLDGVKVNQLDSSALSQKVAFVRAQFPQVDYLEVSQCIALGRTPYTNALGRLSKQDNEQVDKAIAALEIERLRGKFTNNLSDGERQLVAIARALAQDTPIILLDEPTAFLDYPNKQTVLQFLQKISQDQDKCILLSSHDIDLSIDAQCPFLVIPSTSKEAILLSAPIDKIELLNIAFG